MISTLVMLAPGVAHATEDDLVLLDDFSIDFGTDDLIVHEILFDEIVQIYDHGDTHHIVIVSPEPEEQLEDLEPIPCVYPVFPDYDHGFSLTGRGGLAAILAWNAHESRSFEDHRSWSYHAIGAEAAFHLAHGFEAVGGVQLFTTYHHLPREMQLRTGRYGTWLTVHPLNLGLLYKPMRGEWQPYAGIDAILTRYNATILREGLALGGRLRVGADAMLAEHLGLNIDLALGGWGGVPIEWTEARMRNGGLLPQLSFGVVFTD